MPYYLSPLQLSFTYLLYVIIPLYRDIITIIISYIYHPYHHRILFVIINTYSYYNHRHRIDPESTYLVRSFDRSFDCICLIMCLDLIGHETEK